ncbi:non-ribosomal peptide synthetase [Halotalea alkalilenta]|uniref:Carrier domain-containing protein n=1 Tax=Halotalea alkalilenta TaxID=376489 RepID=A0A172YE76_9GAMM|nr:non-ribosomal peptide synthetase [Halotalea alkalilenta]ANF57416.1 hypothetical protein A5892_08020 [Halotalea alkalilenta]
MSHYTSHPTAANLIDVQRYPLTGSQSGVWYAQQLGASAQAYLTGQALEIRGALDADRLACAIESSLAEVEVLRARFDVDTEGPFQQLEAHPPIPLARIDLSAHPTPREAAWEWMLGRLERVLDPASDPLVEQALLRIAERHWIWFSSIHHLQFDAYAYGLLQQRAAEHYQALGTGVAPREAWFGRLEARLEAERAYRESPACLKDRDYWHGQLAEAGEAVSLAGRFSLAAPRPQRHRVTLDAQRRAALARLADSLDATLPELLLAMIASYLARMTASASPVLGLPMMGRLDASALRTPVSVVNVLPLRIEAGLETGLVDWLAQLRKALSGARRHQRYRHEWLARELDRLPGEAPLSGPQVNILPFAQPRLFDGCATETHHLAPGPVDDMTLSLYLGNDDDALHLTLESNPKLYSAPDALDHLTRLVQWCETLATHPRQPVGELPIATAEELERIERWNDTDHPVEETDLATLFERQVARTPDAEALAFEGERLDYRTLDTRARRLAALILARLDTLAAPAPQTPRVIGVALPRSLELEIALLAIHKCAAAYMPLPLDQPPGRWQRMIERAAPLLVICDADHAQALPEGVEWLEFDARDERLTAPSALDQRRLPARSPTDPAYVLFTSGSTGEPKGVVIEHRAIVNRLEWMQHEYRLSARDRVLQKTPVGFDVSVWELFWPLLHGATLVMARPEGHRDPRYLAEIIAAESITTLHFVPSMLAAFLDELEHAPRRLPSLRQVFASGEALKRGLVERFQRAFEGSARLHNLYGPTEAAVDVTYWPCERLKDRASVPIGHPIWNTRIEILDPQGLRLPVGVIGELHIGGRNLARGYIGRPELTTERFVTGLDGQRLYKSGDLARWNPAGELEYHGRIDHQVKLRGQRLELDEIEAVLERHPAVEAAAVNLHAERLIGYLVLAEDSAIDWRAELDDHLHHWLPDYMVPSALVPIERLPLSPNGKLDRRALPPPPEAATPARRAPSSPRERELCALFAATLALDEFGADDDFFDLGGHSLAAVQLALRIREATGEEVSIATVFTAPTPARMARELDQAQREGALDRLLTLRRAAPGSRTPTLFCFHPAGGLAWCYAGLARVLGGDGAVIGVQAEGLREGETPPESLEAMARDYLAALRTRQPHGPYRLLGWSLGGMVAHTVAALLQEDGEEVELLALLDAYPSDLWRHMMPPDEHEALVALLRLAGVEAPPGAPVERATVVALLEHEQHAMASLDTATLDRLVDVVINSSRLVRASHHLRYRGGMLFFTAAAPREQHWLERSAWAPYVEGEIVGIDLDCDHPGMIRPEMLARIATRIDQWLAP